MTSPVPDVPPFLKYIATEGQTTFDYNFPIWKSEELLVYVNNAQVTSGLTVNGAGLETNRTFVFDVGLSENDIVTVYRAVVIERESSFGATQTFLASSLNVQLNKIFSILQDHEHFIHNHVLAFARYLDLTGFDNEAVSLDSFKGKAIGVNSSGTALTPFDGGGGGEPVTDHGALAGLEDADHIIASVQGLQAALDAKSSTSHNHSGVYAADGHNHDLDYSDIAHTHATAYAALLHAATHKHGGNDEIATETPTPDAIPKAGAGGTLAAGWIPGAAGGGGLTPQTITISASAYALVIGKLYIVTSNDESGADLPAASSAGSLGLMNTTADPVVISPDGGDTITVNEHAGLTSLEVPPRGLRFLHTPGNGIWYDETAKQVWQAVAASAEFVEIRGVDGTVIGGFNSDSSGGLQILVAKNGKVTAGISSGHGHIFGPYIAAPGNPPATSGEYYAYLLNGLITAINEEGQQFQMLANKMPKKSVTTTPYAATWNDGWPVLSGSADVVNLPAATNSLVGVPITNDTATAVTVNRNGTDQMLTENGSGQTTFDIPAGGTVLVIDETTSSGDDVRVIGTLA